MYIHEVRRSIPFARFVLLRLTDTRLGVEGDRLCTDDLRDGIAGNGGGDGEGRFCGVTATLGGGLGGSC